jgi:hypothetical protein
MPTPSAQARGALAVAEEHRASTGAVKAAQMAAIIKVFRLLDPARPIASWIGGVGERVYVLLSAGQEAVAGQAGEYVFDALAVQGLVAEMPTINARNFAGIASDGRSLETLLAGAAIRVSLKQRQGASPAQAMQAGEAWLRMVVDTQITDASRAADSVGIATVDAFTPGEDDPAPAAPSAPVSDLEQRAQRALAAPAAGPSQAPPSPSQSQSLADQRAELERRRDELLARVRAGRPAARPDARPSGRTSRSLATDRAAQVERIKAETLARIEQQRREREAARTRPDRDINRGARSRRQVSVGYVRLLTPPSCSRCAVLAGRFYKWSAGFERHPMCDCRHVVATSEIADDLTSDPDAYFRSLSREQQDYYFGKANAEAIRSGADLSRVVNAQDGMYVADDGRRYTRTSTSRRGGRGKRGGPPVLRPTVWQIYKDAQGDRERAKRALEYNGYTVAQRSQ